MPKIEDSGDDSASEKRGSIKAPRAVTERFYASANAHAETAAECLTRLLDAASTTDTVQRGAVQHLIDTLAQLEEQQSVAVDSALTLSSTLVALCARIDDGGSAVAAALPGLSKGGVS